MLHRYDIAIDGETGRLSIDEHAELGRRRRNWEEIMPNQEKYFHVYTASYSGDRIRAAIGQGKAAVIDALRSEGFFPVAACAELLAEKVIELFAGGEARSVELFFDDQNAIPVEDEDFDVDPAND
jgi:hypothetical protein